MFFVVDRIEGDVAVLVGDDDTNLDIPRRQLPATAREGSVFRITYDNSGRPDWATAEMDEVEERKRRREMKQRQD